MACTSFFPFAVCFSWARGVFPPRVACLDRHDARNRQQHGDRALLQFINETQRALTGSKIPAFIPLTDSCLKTCIITHHIRFSSLLAFIILHTGFHLSVSSFLSFFFSLVRRFFFFFVLGSPTYSCAGWITSCPPFTSSLSSPSGWVLIHANAHVVAPSPSISSLSLPGLC